jgi:cell division protein FtsN
MTKPVKRVDVSKLTSEQRQALAQFIRDCNQAAPHIEEMKQTAQTIYQEWLRSPQWRIVEGQREGEIKQSLWHVKPEINYVDHIEGIE